MKDLMKIYNIKSKLQYISVLILLIGLAFIDRSRSVVYTIFQILAVYNLIVLDRNSTIKNSFFIYYGLIFIWAVVVTALSPVLHDSLVSLRYWLLPLILYLALYDYDILSVIRKYIWIPSILLFFANIILFIYWSSAGSSPFIDTKFYQICYYLVGDWTAKIYTSTVVLCILIFIWFYLDKSIYKTSLIMLNLISGLLSYDRMFIFSLAIIILLYLFLEKIQLSFKRIVLLIVSISIIVILLAVLLHVVGMNLHYKERFEIYNYWLPMINVSPIYGIGVGRNSLYAFFKVNYPVPADLLARNPFIPYTSHNFFLDLLITQGFIGLALYLLALYKIISTSIKNAINYKYRFVTLYIMLAIFSKFLVDNQLDNRKILAFWFFIVCSYLINQVSREHHDSK